MVKTVTEAKDIPTTGKVVIDFFANWCGPCVRFAPKFEEYANKPEYKDITFLKVNVDEASALSETYGISSLPTFLFVENGRTLFQLEGAIEKDFAANLAHLKNK